MGSIEISPSKTHILAFPFPAKGHINPMLHLCNRLAAKGFRVTLITTISTYKDIEAKAKGGLIDLESIPDGVEKSWEQLGMSVYFKKFRDSVTESMAGVIEKYKLLGSDFSPKILIYDSTVPWMLDVAQGHGVLGACFFTQPCCVCAVFYHMFQGTLAAVPPLDGNESSGVFLLPCLPPMESIDLPGFEYFKENSGILSKLLLDQFLNIDKVGYILFNTFDKLETAVTNWMASKWKILTVGPIAPTTTTTNTVLLEEEEEKKTKNNKYLFETNAEVCMKWLDEREPNSVIYVSFGSIATLTEEQMEEIAEGLLISNFNFLWIVRDEQRSKLPNDHPIMNNNSSVSNATTITTTTGKSGLIINWCPQLDVLSHGSVACFMTHCGWNSTLEAISSGVPMIAVPQWVDQTTNAKFIQDVWKIGVRVKVDGDGCRDGKDNGLVRREEIVRCVREVCESESEKAKELKRNAMKWKGLAKEAISEGRSSDRNLEEFALNILFY